MKEASWIRDFLLVSVSTIVVVSCDTKSSDISVCPAGCDYSTIQTAVDAAEPGATMVIEPGTYQEEVLIKTNGLTLRAETPGTVVLEGSPIACWDSCSGNGIAIAEVDNVTVDGLELRHFEVGIAIDGNERQFGGHSIVNSTFRSNAEAGIQIWESRNITIDRGQFIDPHPPGESTLAQQDYGINFYHSDNNTVKNSYFWGQHNQAISFKKNDHGAVVQGNTFEGCLYTCIYIGQNDEETDEADQWCSDITVEENVFRPAAEPYRLKNAVNVRNVKRAIVRNNFMEGMNADSGHAIWVWHRENGPEDVQIYNNVVRDSARPAFNLEQSEARNIVTHNNTLINTAGVVNNPLNGENNIVEDDYDYQTNSLNFRGPFETMAWPSEPDPKFEPDFSRALVFQPMPRSSAIDAGISVDDVKTDLTGTNRPEGQAYDVGAFEVSVTKSAKTIAQ